MRLSIIIACYNGAATIGCQLEALAGQHWIDAWEVVVSDNSSTDETLTIVERYRARLPHLKIVHAKDRKGTGYARRIGVQSSSGDALLFLDQDDEVAKGWLMAMGRALSQADFVACRLDTKKLNPDWTQVHDSLQQDGLHRLGFYPYVQHAGGSTIGVKRAVYDAVGGFDENFRYLDDADLCCKLQLAGVRLHFVPDAVLHYRYRSSSARIYRQARNWAQETVRLFKKYRLPGGSDRWRWHPYLVVWKRTLKELLLIPLNARARARLAWIAGWQVGLLRGSIKYWIPPPCGDEAAR